MSVLLPGRRRGKKSVSGLPPMPWQAVGMAPGLPQCWGRILEGNSLLALPLCPIPLEQASKLREKPL